MSAVPASVPVRIQVVDPLAVLPVQALPGDAGFDLRSVMNLVIEPGETEIIRIGLAIEIPVSCVAFVCSRSGLAAKHSVAVLNAPGVVDSGFRGELMVILHNHGVHPFVVMVGDRVAQLVIQEYLHPVFEVVAELSDSVRGAGSVGSTGTN
jgi:dUTP pyrophosphatase